MADQDDEDEDDVDDDDEHSAALLGAMKRSWASDAHFFANSGKEERERWVVQNFLTTLTMTFALEEIKSCVQSSKVDVEFRDARFQIKEIVTPGSRRTAEIKAIAQQVEAAKTLSETIGPGFVYDTPTVANGYELVRDQAKQLAEDPRYSNVKGSIDLLIYVTRTRASIARKTVHSDAELSATGWRSVCYLAGQHAVVLFAQIDAPDFLRSASNGI